MSSSSSLSSSSSSANDYIYMSGNAFPELNGFYVLSGYYSGYPQYFNSVTSFYIRYRKNYHYWFIAAPLSSPILHFGGCHTDLTGSNPVGSWSTSVDPSHSFSWNNVSTVVWGEQPFLSSSSDFRTSSSSSSVDDYLLMTGSGDLTVNGIYRLTGWFNGHPYYYNGVWYAYFYPNNVVPGIYQLYPSFGGFFEDPQGASNGVFGNLSPLGTWDTNSGGQSTMSRMEPPIRTSSSSSSTFIKTTSSSFSSISSSSPSSSSRSSSSRSSKSSLSSSSSTFIKTTSSSSSTVMRTTSSSSSTFIKTTSSSSSSSTFIKTTSSSYSSSTFQKTTSSSYSSSSSEVYGPSIVTNGNFNGSAKGWSMYGGAYYSSNSMIIPQSSIPIKSIGQVIPTISGHTYLVKVYLTIDPEKTLSPVIQLGGTNHTFDSITAGPLPQPEIFKDFIVAGDSGSIKVSITTGNLNSGSITSVEVREWLADVLSSSSSISSSSSSGSSSSSQSSFWKVGTSSSSSNSSSSQSSRSSTEILTTSSSSLSSSSSSTIKKSTSSLSSSSTKLKTSSSSSLSSGNLVRLTVPFDICGVADKSILCFLKCNGIIYAGTASNKIVQSTNGVNWTNFIHNGLINDDRISSLYYWGNALFIGTQPRGKIYVNNFSTNQFYQFVQTPDQSVESFVDCNGVLYAGTSPMGFIYSFNGSYWKQEFQAYGGVSSMQSASFGFLGSGGSAGGSSGLSENLFVFLKNAETGVVFDGTQWSILPLIGLSQTSGSGGVLGNQTQTISSFRNLTTNPIAMGKFIDPATISSIQLGIESGLLSSEDGDVVTPTLPEFTINSSVKTTGGIALGGSGGDVYFYDGDRLVRELSTGNPITAMASLGDGSLIVASDNNLYLIPAGSAGFGGAQ